MKFYCISFATHTKFLGAALVHADSASEAIERTNLLGIKPGGQAAIAEVDDPLVETPNGPVPQRLLGRLLQKAELEECFGENAPPRRYECCGTGHTAMMSDELWAGLGGGLLGGVLGAAGAILAVIVDRHIERKNHAAEEARQLRNIAKALVLEIEGFSRFCEALVSTLSGVSRHSSRQVLLELPPLEPFPIYTANADRIGEFQADETAAMVAFFTSAASIVSALNEAVRGQARSLANRDVDPSSLSNIQLTAILTGLAKDGGPNTLSLAAAARILLLKRAENVSS